MTQFVERGENLYKFKWYLHDDKWALVEALYSAGLITKEQAEDPPASLMYAFYEVELDCWVDLETGAVSIESAY